jgi:class 3 adenylate cyclase/tetratricopeptide (TPR) repeat protein
MTPIACPTCSRENPEGFAFCGFCGAALEAAVPAREVRKTVTIVFADVTGSTALGERLDPESLRRVMGRYFDAMRTVIERHGGTVEKFIGDAVMAVFGIPVLHEDDALRAVRAAWEMREALESLNADLLRERGVTIATRTGVNTGEVVAGDPTADQTLVTGDAVNTAARLEQAAAPGEILLGDATYGLVRDAVGVEPVAPLELKGKAEPVSAHRLVDVRLDAAGHARHLDSPMVGRDRELALIRESFDRAVSERECHLFTLLGPAGVGKSRLVEEFLGGVAAGAVVLRGRCLPYGEGITFFPVADVVRQAVGAGDVGAGVGRLVEDAERAPMVVQRLAGLLGESGEPVATEETFWAVRTLFEGIAHRNPLVVVFDDIHWGEPTFLDLVEHVADWSKDAPILLLCVARPEMLDHRPAWGGGKMNASSILLEPLSDDQAGVLIGNLLGSAGLAPAARSRITEAAEGNPLFVEEMLAMLIDEGLLVPGEGGWVAAADLSAVAVPPTIQALLAARLDRLEGPQRSVIERASVVGKEFWRGAVVELSPEAERTGVPANLMTLVRKELIRPGRSTLAGDDAFRFRHLLIRDAAYDSMSKEHRADLHERFALWLERAAGDRAVEFEEILGYHLEQAARYRLELGPADAASRALASRAAGHLASAGERALARGDRPAMANLLGRAVELLEPGSPARTRLLPFLADALHEIGDLAGERRVLDDGLAEVRASGDGAAERRLEILELFNRASTDPTLSQREMGAAVERMLAGFREAGDDSGAALASLRLGLVRFWQGRAREAFESLQPALEYARRVGDRRLELEGLEYTFGPLTWGPFAVEEALRRCDEVRAAAAGHRRIEVYLLCLRAYLVTLVGRFDEGRELFEAALGLADEIGMGTNGSTLAGQEGVEILAVAGDLPAAAEMGRRGIADLQRMGETGFLSTAAGYTAGVLVRLGEDAEAERMVELTERTSAADDFVSQELWRRARAELLSKRGEHEVAEELARAAVGLTSASDYTMEHAGSRMTLAVVLEAAGRPAEAADEVRRAVELYVDKGATVLVDRARAELARLGGSAPGEGPVVDAD